MKHLCLLGFFRWTLVWNRSSTPKMPFVYKPGKPHNLSKYVTSPYQHVDTTPLLINFQKKIKPARTHGFFLIFIHFLVFT